MRLVKADDQVQRDVLDELCWDTRIEATDVGVEIDDGVVTLTGTVNSYAKKLAAREAAHRVAGVLDVVDDIKVKLPSSHERTDTDIAQAVRHALIWNTFVPEERIRTTVMDGWVILEGEVSRLAQAQEAEHAVRYLFGVRGVANNVTVRVPDIAATTVRRTIEDALERRADREAERLKISVDSGRVTLTGRVQNWAERQAILRAVSHAPGVREVGDELQVGMLG